MIYGEPTPAALQTPVIKSVKSNQSQAFCCDL